MGREVTRQAASVFVWVALRLATARNDVCGQAGVPSNTCTALLGGVDCGDLQLLCI